MNNDFIISLLSGTLRTSTPIILAALGQVYTQKAGIMDLSVEGTMIIGCLVGFMTAFFTQNLIVGMLCAGIAGMAIGAFMAYLSITVKANQVIAGTALTMFGTGFASYLYRVVFGVRKLPPVVQNFAPVNFGKLGEIPFVGPVFFSHNGTFYFALILVLVTWFVMEKTVFGLQVKAVGEYPSAADAKGIKVGLIRYSSVILGGLYSGLAGATMSLGYMNTYTDHMIAGRGFIAIAVVVFARWLPVRVLLAALLFGCANTLQMRLQSIGVAVPSQLLQALPYILTVLVLLGVSKYVNFPGGFGIPYSRNEK
ncbi:putative ABC-type transport system, permease component [Sphaerochaeta pleomorpha str. Grapes]|uniref:Putative ABC-type transport system, permease component n=1 Tax=Sphaerochaeta pleomorpha (strain ATCC BAA-1885 / DSM 22778 / Grapes) TaxID=158190 RepID=G8QXK8_SPHPG|nr:ABC transporter permease [Sphaerochaeta pleomorpha]AEV29571.1 putative ABC-type transport system, permease component [Sphaerochaeta pleomorpha str. Grapes]